MEKFLKLNPDLKNKDLLIHSIQLEDKNSIEQLKNIGIYKGNTIFVCDYNKNKYILNIIVENIQYAIRINDAKNIMVRELNNEEKKKLGVDLKEFSNPNNDLKNKNKLIKILNKLKMVKHV